MDISSKYRTKCPPKEHEEAVRMLLEGIGKQDKQITGTLKHPKKPSSNSYEFDERSIQSLSQSIESSELNQSHFDGANDIETTTHHKATSNSDSNSSSGIDYDAMFREPIPSRTIAVQCDLKSSSTKRLAGDHLIDGSMQASSISSTRYGFYNFTPETLENRRKMQRSLSNRDLALGSRGADAGQAEAPTSMSELSVSDNELDARHLSSKGPYRSDHGNHTNKNFTTSSSSYSSSSHSYIHQDSRQKINGKGLSTRAINQADGSSMADDSSTARARINSLPRRPMTALSYVSTTKLRNNQSPSRRLTSDSSDTRPIKNHNRTMSQQTLTRPRTPAAELVAPSSGSDSDSELLDSIALKSRFGGADVTNNQSDRSSRRQDQCSVADSKRGEMSPVKPPRPTLVSSKHEEQVLDYKTLERNPSIRPGVLSDRTNERSGYKYTSRQAPEMDSQYRSRLRDENDFDKFATIDRNRYKDSYKEAEYSSRLRSQPPMVRPSPLSNGGEPGRISLDSQRRGSSPSKDVAYQAPLRQDYRHNSMSLSRRLRPAQPLAHNEDRFIRGPEVNETNGYCTTSRVRPHKLSRNGRAHSQTHLPKPTSYILPPSELTVRRPVKQNPDVEVTRSTSVRHIDRPLVDRYDPDMYATPIGHDSIENHHYHHDGPAEISIHNPDYPSDDLAFKNKREVDAGSFNRRDKFYQNQESDGDSDSPLTRTWANPSVRSVTQLSHDSQLMSNRKSSRSFSVRDVNGATDFNANDTNRYERYGDYHTKVGCRKNDLSSYNSSSESSSLENAQRFARQQQQHNLLDHNSQHRLNEIGLPEVNPIIATSRRPDTSGSYLGITGSYRDGLYTSSRAPQITGRAMSQQSLTRPTMPLMSSRRRAGSNHSGSDVGGSSMSLVSRLHGRYENAHTRTPVVMYIPKAMPRASSHGEGGISLIGKSSTLRKNSRSRQKSSSQDRSKRSLSRNGSDSESSSMLRTLVRPRSRLQANYSSKRTARMHSALHNDEDEDIDGIGQLASEMDSYKFRRRYSVPKDAKINWFAKLKQRVSSGGK